MTVSNEKGQLKIVLTEYEIIEYNVSEVLFESRPEIVRSVLTSLLKKAAAETGFKADSDRISIEIYPIFEGGCVIYFIPENYEGARQKMPYVKKATLRKSACILEFNDSENLIRAVGVLYHHIRTRNILSSIFLIGGKFRLVLPDGFSSQKNMPSVFCFCDRIITRRIEKAKTFEYGKPIVLRSAVNEFGRIFTKT